LDASTEVTDSNSKCLLQFTDFAALTQANVESTPV